MAAPLRSPHPWYREPWPWFLIAVPAASIVMGAVLWTVAARSDDGLVATDYYKRGLAINQKVRQLQAAPAPPPGATVRIEGGEVVVQLEGDDAGSQPPVIRLTLAHPGGAPADRVAGRFTELRLGNAANRS
jgi:hypothetical protein